MKKVLYVITSSAHKRVFESFEERADLDQYVIGPKPAVSSRFVPEDYSDFKIKNIVYFNSNNISKEISDYAIKIKPDVYVQGDLTNTHKKAHYDLAKIHKYKKVYVSHGMVGSHVKGIIKKAGFDTSVWKGMDLYCGATNVFADWVKHVAKVDDSKILLNALPQLDIIYDSNYYESYRQSIVSKTKKQDAKKVILFIGFCCRDRCDFNEHNEDYFRTAINLSEEAKRQKDWLVLIKPRQHHGEMMKFLSSHSWGKKYIKDYQELQNNDNVHFITAADAHIYRYYFADAFVMNGCSTAEIEACAIGKPLFMVRTDMKALQSNYDPYNTVSSGAAMSIPDISELSHCLINYFQYGKYHYPDKQKLLLNKMGLIFDGKMHQRIQDKLLVI